MRYSFFILFQIFSFTLVAQQDTLLLNKRVDSLMQLDYSKYTARDYQLYQEILEGSKETKFVKGILKSYIGILDYHTKHAQIDSVFHYSHQFETYQKLNPHKKLQSEYLYIMGFNLLYKFNLPEYALPYYIEALKIHDNEDVKTKFKLINGITHCYMYKEQYDLAVEHVRSIIKDTIHVGTRSKNVLKMSLAIAYQFIQKPEKSKPILAQILQESIRNQDSLHCAFARVYKGYNLYLEKEYYKSIDTLRSNFNLLEKYWPEGVANHYEFLSLSYAKLKKFEKATDAMRRAARISPINELPKLYDHLAAYYITLGKKDSALYYNAKKSHIVDSIRHLEKKIYTDFYQTKLDFIKTTKENEKIKLEQLVLSKENKKQKSYIISLFIGIICLISGSVAFVFYKKNDQSKKEINFLKQNEKKILQKHIKLRENELSAVLIGHANKMQGLKKIRDQLYEVLDANTPENLKKPIKSFDRFLKTTTSGEILTDRIESQYPGLTLQLKEHFPELSKTNIRHCLLIKLGFTVKESADLLNVTPNTVKTARYRAKSKMGLSEDISLGDFLEDSLVSSISSSDF